jgi:hypothetical protein
MRHHPHHACVRTRLLLAFTLPGHLLRFWQRAAEAHFTLTQYREAVDRLLAQLARCHGAGDAATFSAAAPTAASVSRAATAATTDSDGIVLSKTAIMRRLFATLQSLVAEPIFRRAAHPEFGAGCSVCCLCAGNLFDVAPVIGGGGGSGGSGGSGLGPTREEQVTALRLNCDCRMHKSCKMAAEPVVGRNGSLVARSCLYGLQWRGDDRMLLLTLVFQRRCGCGWLAWASS